MNTLNLLAPIFNTAQIAFTVVIVVVFAALAGYNGYLLYRFSRRGEYKIRDKQLQNKREELLGQLAKMKSGEYKFDKPVSDETWVYVPQSSVGAPAPAEGARLSAVTPPANAEILAVKDMTQLMRRMLGFRGKKYDDKRYYVRYSFGFDAKLRSADLETKELYMSVVDELEAYSGIKIKNGYNQQRICKGRTTIGLILFKGKKLCIALALNPADYADTQYRGEDMSGTKRFAGTPMLIRITGYSKLARVKYLISVLGSENELTRGMIHRREYDLAPHTTDEMLQADTLRVIVYGEVTDANAVSSPIPAPNAQAEEEEAPAAEPAREGAQPVPGQLALDEASDEEDDEDEDEEEKKPVEIKPKNASKGDEVPASVTTKVLSEHFKEGDEVDLPALRRKELVPLNATTVTVTFDGELDKPLTVKASKFAKKAEEAIRAAGGAVIKV